MDEQFTTLDLDDGLGNITSFYILDDPYILNNHYVVLYPVEISDREEEGSVIIMKIEKTKNKKNDHYVSVNSEKELNQVFEVFQKNHPEFFE